MTAKMLINATDREELRVAIIRDNELDGFYVESERSENLTGNIYKATIERVEKSLQACFVHFGRDKNGFLPLNDIHPEYFLPPADPESKTPSINNMLKKGQEILVQVTKEMPGNKGPHLTTFLSFAGRFVVLTLGRKSAGISKKIEDEEERNRLKEIMNNVPLIEGTGYIVRTAAVKQPKKEIVQDINRLLRIWKNIRHNIQNAPPNSLIHKEQDVTLRTLRDYLTSDIDEVVVDDKDTFNNIISYMKIIAPRQQSKIKLFKENKQPIFDFYNIEDQIQSIYGNRTILKSGGSIVIEATEALISIDVNSGKGKVGKDIEGTAFNTNKEATVEIARQLRLKDVGGLVVIDFIDMKDRNHNREIEKLLKEECKKDKSKFDFGAISKFGLMELSRQRLRPSIEAVSYNTCTCCGGRGLIPSVEYASLNLLRRIRMGASREEIIKVKGVLSSDVTSYLQNRKRHELMEIEDSYKLEIELIPDNNLAPGRGELYFITSEEEISEKNQAVSDHPDQ